jgi:hypothetical protein
MQLIFYWMFNINTKRIINSRDVVWLVKGYKNWVVINTSSKEYDDDDDDEEHIYTCWDVFYSFDKTDESKGQQRLHLKFVIHNEKSIYLSTKSHLSNIPLG